MFIARVLYPAVMEPEFVGFYRDLADQVVRQRAIRSLSQAELADLSGTTQSAIARFEAGKRPPKLDTLLRIAMALDCQLEVNFRPRTKTRKEST